MNGTSHLTNGTFYLMNGILSLLKQVLFACFIRMSFGGNEANSSVIKVNTIEKKRPDFSALLTTCLLAIFIVSEFLERLIFSFLNLL